jgi:hypothetical protein
MSYEFELSRRLDLADCSYHAKSGPRFERDFVTEFPVTPQDAGVSPRIAQDGFQRKRPPHASC